MQTNNTQKVKQASTSGHLQRFMYKQLIPVGFYRVTVLKQTNTSNPPD